MRLIYSVFERSYKICDSVVQPEAYVKSLVVGLMALEVFKI
ncbi:MAG: hypothetical protein QW547_07125 [Candidatus Bathyarchaeia archaeon]